MFPNDLDPIGDMQCVFSVKSSIPFLVDSRKFPISFSEHLYFTENGVEEYINVPSYLKNDNEYNIFIKRMQVSEVGSNMVFKLSSDDYPEMETLRDLIKIPSVIIDYKYVEGGYHKIIFTFHHSHIQEVSKFIFDARKKFKFGVPEYFGPNRGINYVLEKAQTSGSIIAGAITLNSPKKESEFMKELFSTKWVRRARYTDGSNRCDYLYRIPDSSSINNEVFTSVSGEDKIYGANKTSEISLLYSRLSLERYNPMFYQYHEHDGENLRICGLIPENYRNTMIETIAETSERFPQLDVRLTYSSQLKLEDNYLTQVFGPNF